MTKEQLQSLEDTLETGNYLGALGFISGLGIEKAELSLYLGDISRRILNDLEAVPKSNIERTVYLRTLLQFSFREFPGLAGLYKEQLRLVHGKDDPFQEVLRGVQNVSDLASGKTQVQDEAEKVFRQGIESLGSIFKGGTKPS